MKTISWQTKSSLLFQCLKEKTLSAGANGGNAYDFHAAMALSQKHSLDTDFKSIYRSDDNIFSYWKRLTGHRPSAEIRVMEPYPIVFGGRFKKTFNIAMIHHIDEDQKKQSLKHKWFYNRLIKKIRKFDRVVTVSKYWKDYLNSRGCNNIDVIYNSFNPLDYQFNSDEISAFRTSKGFKLDVPLIYLGNAGRLKGVHKSYEVLKDLPYQFVMTGGTNNAKDIPVRFLNLSALEYRKLIASCDIVLTMSLMSEGWNRVAHEAMLSKVPVIGSGSGGMRELLEGGGQNICSSFNLLPDLINTVIERKGELGLRGYEYTSQFNLEYFKNAWNALIE
ncbi:MAG: glycosyltransferase family 4 protein [Bacteroidetes bacterium]|nr:glycosyltransferase family 4 protein [Bacteroidota bacterium]